MTDRHTVDSINSDQLDDLYDDLARARQELADRAAADSADAAAGSYAGRVQELEAAVTRVRALADRWDNALAPDKPYARALRAALDSEEYAIAWPTGTRWLHVAFTSPDETSANISALAIADHLAAEFDGVRMRITSNAVEVGPSCSPGVEETEPNNPAATEATDVRTRLARALAGHAGSKAFLAEGPEWDHMRTAWYAHADAALAELKREMAALAEYENAITWHTDCLSCARILDSCIRETERAHRLADTIEQVRITVHIADGEDHTDWQRGYRARATRVLATITADEQRRIEAAARNGQIEEQ